MAFAIPENVQKTINAYTTTLISPALNRTLTHRGECGATTENFFTWLMYDSPIYEDIETKFSKTEKGIDIPIIVFNNGLGPSQHVYFKRVCFCDETCAKEGVKPEKTLQCVQFIDEGKARFAACGHFAIIISNNDSLKISETDYILDFTYKQMLVPRKVRPNCSAVHYVDTNEIEYNGKTIMMGNLSPYYLSTVGNISKTRTARWKKEYYCPSKHIYPISFSGGSLKRRTKRRKTRRVNRH